jgi:hypothetical protein
MVIIPEKFETKMELGDRYGLHQALNYGMDWNGDGIVLEWYKQAKAFEEYVVGMDVNEVMNMPTQMNSYGYIVSDDIDLLSAGCTIQIAEFKEAVYKACQDEQGISFKTAEAFTLGVAANSFDDGSTNASYDSYGEVRVYSDFAATVIVDGKIVAALNDAIQPRFTVSTSGELTPTFKGTKRELKEDYNLKIAADYGLDPNGDGIVLEWYIQSLAFSKHVVGMTAAQVLAMETVEAGGHFISTDKDLLDAGCSMQITGLMSVVAKAATNAR